MSNLTKTPIHTPSPTTACLYPLPPALLYWLIWSHWWSLTLCPLISTTSTSLQCSQLLPHPRAKFLQHPHLLRHNLLKPAFFSPIKHSLTHFLLTDTCPDHFLPILHLFEAALTEGPVCIHSTFSVTNLDHFQQRIGSSENTHKF